MSSHGFGRGRRWGGVPFQVYSAFWSVGICLSPELRSFRTSCTEGLWAPLSVSRAGAPVGCVGASVPRAPLVVRVQPVSPRSAGEVCWSSLTFTDSCHLSPTLDEVESSQWVLKILFFSSVISICFFFITSISLLRFTSSPFFPGGICSLWWKHFYGTHCKTLVRLFNIWFISVLASGNCLSSFTPCFSRFLVWQVFFF